MAFVNGKRVGPRGGDWNYGGKNWRLSRSKIDLFAECPRCFYLDNKLGLARPRFPAFTLNIAVDELLKKEFDMHRAQGTAHPLMDTYGIQAVPFADKRMGTWRENFEGVEAKHEPTGFRVCGAVDDIWVNKEGEVMVVDYKATAKDGKMDVLSDTKWENQYKRQMEIYQWLLRQNGLRVSDTGYFVYVNGKKDNEAFDGKLEFDVTIIPYTGKADWVEGCLLEIKKCLVSETIPTPSEECEYCPYVEGVQKATK